MSGNSDDKPGRRGSADAGDSAVLAKEDKTSGTALEDLEVAAALVERCAYDLAGIESVATVSELIRIAADLKVLSKQVKVGMRH